MFFSHSTHFSHMSEPILPISHLSILFSQTGLGIAAKVDGGDTVLSEARAAQLSETIDELGLSPSLSREITAALTAEKHLATMSGDMLACESTGESTGAALNLPLEIGFSPSTISSLKDARFQGLISEGVDDAPHAPRPKPQRPPNPGGDPIHWFAALPPPALRKAQKCFFRGVETCVELANYKARMMRAARNYQDLVDQFGVGGRGRGGGKEGVAGEEEGAPLAVEAVEAEAVEALDEGEVLSERLQTQGLTDETEEGMRQRKASHCEKQ